MRIVKTMADVQKALNELFDWKQSFGNFPKGNLNLNGNRITNAGKGISKSDYVILDQIPVIPSPQQPVASILYTITWNPPDGSINGTISPPFRIGVGRSGSPYQCWVDTVVAPTSDFTFNIQYQGVNLLSTDLKLPAGQLSATTSTFTTPIPFLSQQTNLKIVLTSDNSSSGMTIGLVVQTSPGTNTGKQ